MQSSPSPAPEEAAGTPPRPRPRGFRVPAVIGVVVIGAILSTGTWLKRQWEGASETETRETRAALVERAADVEHYEGRIQLLRWRAERMQAWAQGQTGEPVRTWARERARLFEQMAASFDRDAAAREVRGAVRQIEQLLAAGKVEQAAARLAQLPEVKFPSDAEFRAYQEMHYVKPLAALSRQNPSYYRALLEQEPEIAGKDLEDLRQELEAEPAGVLTPGQLLKVELLGAVVPPEDPLLAEWSAVSNAADFFENPDATVLGHWRRAQRAMRLHDGPAVMTELGAIAKTTVRTRQPFRAAYGWALIKNRPEAAEEAYALLQEAALGGDAAARNWVAEQDLQAGRPGQALRWYEAAVMEGATDAIGPVLALYARSADEVPRDPKRQMDVLQRVVTGRDSPPEAWHMLGELYETGRGIARVPAQAFACYHRAAEKGLIAAWPDVARCWQQGIGTPVNLDQALEWACRAFESGEEERALPIIMEIMQRDPDRAANRVATLLGRENVATRGGYGEKRLYAADLKALRLQLARHFDERGQFARAASLYAGGAESDAAAKKRLGELHEIHPCEACSGSGKIRSLTPCSACGGKGTLVCNRCDGRAFSFEPGSPPCTLCAGAGNVVQDGRPVSCAGCGGTGKGKGSVIKKDCTACVRGRMKCPECVEGRIPLMKECPDCRGAGTWTMATRDSG